MNILTITPGEESFACYHFCENAPEGPHVHLVLIIHPENDLWGPVVSRHHVRGLVELSVQLSSQSEI